MQCRRGGYPSPERRNMICPKCNRDFSRLLALSRTDNETMICDECGTKEALDAVGFTEGSPDREAILKEAYYRKTPQDRVKAAVAATGNRWAMEISFRIINGIFIFSIVMSFILWFLLD